MNSSMDRWNTFRRLAGPALFAACALALGTTLAVAQEVSGAEGNQPRQPPARRLRLLRRLAPKLRVPKILHG